MVLPPALHLGPHALRILPVCRSAEIAPGMRGCSDSLLTAFCFVGELQTDAVDFTREVSDAARDSKSRGASIVWYYSPLFQYERKRIRVEEGVIEASLTKAVEASQHADVNSPSLHLRGAKTAEYEGSCPARLSEASSAALSVTSATALPALYLRVGSSTTFREYGLVVAGLQRAAQGASAEPCMQSHANTAGSDGDRSAHAAHKPPVFLRLTPNRPTLKPIDTQLNGSDLQSMRSLTHRRNTSPRRDATLSSASAQRSAAQMQDGVRSSPWPSSLSEEASTATVGTSLLRSESDRGNKPDGATFSRPVSLFREEDEPFVRTSQEGASSQRVLRVKQWVKSEECARKDIPPGSHHFDGADGSNVSSALFSNSIFSSLPFQAPASGLSTMGTPETDMDDCRSCSTAASGLCGGFLDNAHLRSLEITYLAFDAFTSLAQSTSCPTPPAAPKPRFVRRLPLCTYANNSGFELSTLAPHASAAQGIRLELEPAIAATPQSSR
ncbi:hypothetical protein GH5_02091 [Leishmania sp. Ghana 2012 LV757]|uniref:hypothetical protein n=1 Tax=Leishmania sp. Ghana 2012 LV757 TaxID=2803181 RepID=UPI001B61F640|nr:hypothetical protein GH5_02091 [Leishmania sp. Ghana 2012 LV757]